MTCQFCGNEDCEEECVGFRQWFYYADDADQAKEMMAKREPWLAAQLIYKAGYAACLEKLRERGILVEE